MKFSSTALFAAFFSFATATNTIHFVNQDSTTRTIYFTANPGLANLSPLVIPGSQTINQDFPDKWIGNWYSVSDGAANKPGMLGEISWNSWNGITFFDVSAIVDPTDNNGVKMIFPINDQTLVSGCHTFPCGNVYVKPDDIQTQATTETELVCLLGSGLISRRRGAVAEAIVAEAAAAAESQ
jgi:hypothetical protein